MNHFVLHDDLNKVKEALSLKEEAFATDFAKLENKFLKLKQKVESLLDENNKLLHKLKQVELDLAANRKWNRASHALNWLSNHPNQGRKGLGFQPKHTVVVQAEVRGNNITTNTPSNSPENSLGNNLGISQLWYVDSGCSRHMTGVKSNFLSPTTT